MNHETFGQRKRGDFTILVSVRDRVKLASTFTGKFKVEIVISVLSAKEHCQPVHGKRYKMNFDCLYYWSNVTEKWITVENHGEDVSLPAAKKEVEGMGFEVVYGYKFDPPIGKPEDIHTDIHSGGVFFKHAERS